MMNKETSFLDLLPSDWAARHFLNKRREVRNEGKTTSTSSGSSRCNGRVIPRSSSRLK